MNRRELIKRTAQAGLGVVGIVVGLKAAPTEKPFVLHVDVRQDRHAIVDVFMEDFQRAAIYGTPSRVHVRGKVATQKPKAG